MTQKDAEQNAVDLHIGKRIRRRRRLLGLTQQQLGNLVGSGPQQIQKYECGTRTTASKLYHIAKALRTPIAFFFEGLVEKNPNDEPGFDVDTVVNQKDTRELIRAYYSLNDTLRLRLLDFATSLQPETNDNTPEK